MLALVTSGCGQTARRRRGWDHKLMRKTKQPGLDNRHRDLSGQIDKKHGNTTMKSLRKQYGQDFASGRRSDLMLKTLRDEKGGKSLSQILKA
jgi:hypothetical protein